MDKLFNITPIGYIRTQNNEYWLQIEKEFIPALKGLESFSHINVMWWFHLLDAPDYRKILIAQKPYKNAPEQLGILSTRAPIRPNPLGLSVVQVFRIDFETGKIHIGYIDAEDNTPVVDLKPYYPCSERVKEVSTPTWCSTWPQWYEDSSTFDWGSVFENAR